MTAAAAVLILGGGAAAARAITGLLVTVAVIAVVLLAAAVPLLVWRLRVARRRDTEAAAAYAAKVQAMGDAKRLQALEDHQRALEIARAGAPVIQNVIDPAALLAAAFAPRPAPYRAEVVRAEVER